MKTLNDVLRVSCLVLLACAVCSCASAPFAHDALLERIAAARPQGILRAVFFNPTNGDSALLVFPSGRTVLVDGGHTSRGRELVRALGKLGIAKLDAVVLSHPDIDHYGGLRFVFGAIEVGHFYHSGLESWTPQFRSFLKEMRASGCAIHRIREGDTVAIDPLVTCAVLWPPQGIEDNTRSSHFANTNSLVLRVRYRNVVLLLTGDIKDDSEAVLVEKDAAGLATDVLKVAHHGSRSSSSEAFVRAAGPEVAVIMGERFNIERGAFRRPADETLQRLEDAGARIVRTWKEGATVIETDGATLTRILSARDTEGESSSR